MSREITVLLKHQETIEITPAKQLWGVINEFVKSPLFVFIFGASLATIYPTFKNIVTPASELEIQKTREEARADAALVAPFLANLSANEPGKFQASRAALQALEHASSSSANGKESPMFVAVNKAIDAVAKQIWPPTEKAALTAAVVQQIDKNAKAASPLLDSANISYSLLQNAAVYIQVNRENRIKQETAERILEALRSNSVVAPDIQKLAPSTMPNKTQIRYFHDSDRAKAEDLASIVSQETKLTVYIAKPNLDAKEGTLEIWLGKE